MCKVSDKLWLCSCEVVDFESLKHYWKLNRPTGEDDWIVGQAMLPADIGEEAEKYNYTLLRKLLNEGNCFDIEIQPSENDILVLYFTYKPTSTKRIQMPYNGSYLAYAFEFKKGKWKKGDYDPFESNVNLVQGGKIKSAFK